MKALLYRIDLLEPLLATRLGGEPNSATSEPFVPGSMVRGAVMAAYLVERRPERLDAGDERAQRLFFDGRTRYLNAYPGYPSAADPAPGRTLPLPWSWLNVKDAEAQIYDFALAERREVNGQPVQFKAARGGDGMFCRVTRSASGATVIRHEGKGREIKVHTQRNRMFGRALSEEQARALKVERGAVFQYDALASGETYVGAVLAEDDADLALLAHLLPMTLSLGGSHNSGYGRVRVTVLGEPVADWRETGEPALDIPAGQSFVVTLLSDALLRDPATGQRTLDPAAALSAALGVTLTPAAAGVSGRSTARARNVGGFNRAWGLPLPQAQAVSAGSAFVYTASAPLAAERIRVAEAAGIGQRCAEGFGRFVVGWQRAAELAVGKADAVASDQPAPQLNGAAARVAGLMLDRLLRQQLDEALRRTLNELTIERPPQTAQLSRLRVIARDALANLQADASPTAEAAAFERLTAYLRHVDERRSARDQFERSRIHARDGSMRLRVWLDDLLKKPGGVWAKMGVSDAAWKLGANVERRPDLRLAREYAIRLLDGLLAKAARERKAEDDGQEQER